MTGTLARAWQLEDDAHWKQAMATLQGRHVLLAEDNTTNQEIILALLEHSGIRVTVVSDGRKAVKMIEAGEDVDLVLMDIHMPHMNGYDAARKIREYNASIPIVAFTTDAGKYDIAQAKAAGMSDHLSKPIDVKRFYVVLWKHLGLTMDTETFMQSMQEKENPQEPLLSFDLIDAREGLKRVLHNRKIYINILRGLYGFRHVRLDEIIDPEEFKRTIHTIKGLSAGAGAHALYRVTHELDRTQDRNLIWDFYHVFNAVIEELQDKCLFDASPIHDSKKIPLTVDKREELYLELLAACATRRIRHVQPVMTKIEQFTLSPEDKKLYNDIKMFVRQYKFKEAGEFLRDAKKNDFNC